MFRVLFFLLQVVDAQCGETFELGEVPVFTVSPGNYSGYEKYVSFILHFLRSDFNNHVYLYTWWNTTYKLA